MSSDRSEPQVSGNPVPGRVLVVIGTRPEAIKMAPVVAKLREARGVDLHVCVTGQHREMLDSVIELFGIRTDYDLNVMTPSQTLPELTARILAGVTGVVSRARPEFVLVHGDTTTTFASSLASFYAGARVGHVEAGLRTRNLRAPWPEEANRRLTSVLTDLHFAPTEGARDNLLAEGVDAGRIFITGNTVVDALLQARARLDVDASLRDGLEQKFGFLRPEKRLLLVTGHRRESFGEGFVRLCDALTRIAKSEDVDIVYPVHLNPKVREPVMRILGQVPNVHLLEPLDYLPFVYLMARSDVILTDSGGIQEEAPSLGKPVLVTRESTERPEAVRAGTALLVGTDEQAIINGVRRMLHDESARRDVLERANPYGDGHASERIVRALLAAMRSTN
jgi:UDP-N-acetylglucosamine 2-epimerase (non-hydrolysing)